MFGVRVELLVACFVIFCASRVYWPYGIGPFGEALLISASRLFPSRRSWLLISILVGGFSKGGPVLASSYLLFWVAYRFLSRRFPQIETAEAIPPRDWMPWRRNLVRSDWALAVSAIFGCIPYVLAHRPDVSGMTILLAAFFHASLLISVYPLLQLGLRSLNGLVETAGAAHRYASGRDRLSRCIVGRTEATGLAFLFAIVVAGLSGLTLGSFKLQQAFAVACVTAVAWAKGAGAGVLTGVAAGVVSSIAGRDALATLGLYVLVGALAGLFGFWGRLGAAGGALLALGFGSLSLWDLRGEIFVDQLGGALAGLSLLCVVPKKWFAEFIGTVDGDGFSLGGTGSREGDGDTRDDAEPLQGEEPLQSLVGVLNEIARAFEEMAASDFGSLPEEEVAAMVNRISVSVCSRCDGYAACWGKGFRESYTRLATLIAVAEEGGSPPEACQEWLGSCRRPVELSLASSFLVEMRQLDMKWRARLDENRMSLVGYLKGLAALLAGMSHPGDGEAGGRDIGISIGGAGSAAGAGTPLRYSVEVLKMARDGRLVSGDSHLVRELPANRLLIVISDGMGNGDRAARESRAAVNYVERLISVGFDVKTSIRVVNAMLLMRSREETFATLDLAIIDLLTGEGEAFKVGAAPSFLYQSGRVITIKGNSPPLGIIDSIELNAMPLRVGAGDTLVMASDGLFEPQEMAVERETDIVETVGRVAGENGGEGMAQELLNQVASSGCLGSDDVTVIAVRFEGALTEGSEG